MTALTEELQGWTAGTSDDSHRMVWLMKGGADEIERLREALRLTYSRVPDDKAQDLGFVEALLNQQ